MPRFGCTLVRSTWTQVVVEADNESAARKAVLDLEDCDKQELLAGIDSKYALVNLRVAPEAKAEDVSVWIDDDGVSTIISPNGDDCGE